MNLSYVNQIHGGNIEKAKDTYNLDEERILDFSANINFSGPPPGLMKELKDNMEKIIHYPESHSVGLTKKLASSLNISEDNLIISNGAVELIYQIVERIKPELTLLPVPSFSEYEFAIKSINGKIKYVYYDSENKLQANIDEIISHFEEANLLILCNPNNPTGTLIKLKNIHKLIEYAQENGVFVVMDEAFIDFVKNNEDYTAIDLINNYDNLFILRSMTKFYAIPGLRLGYGIGNPDIIKSLKNNRDPWSVNTMAQIAGIYVLNDIKYREKSRELNFIERDFLYQKLQEIKEIKPYKPTANYIFMDISVANLTSDELTDKLAREHILIRNCSSYKGLDDRYIRIAVKRREDNLQLINKLKSIIKN